MAEFEPLIIAFACNWCTYAAADLAGTSRIQYPPNVRLIRVMCSGMVEPDYVFRALEGGADGVLIAGCHHIERLKRMTHILGLEDERLRHEMISTSEGVIFARVIEDMVTQLKKLGPSPFKKERVA